MDTPLTNQTAAVNQQPLGVLWKNRPRTLLLSGVPDGATVEIQAQCPQSGTHLTLQGASYTAPGAYTLEPPPGLPLFLTVSGGGINQDLTLSIH